MAKNTYIDIDLNFKSHPLSKDIAVVIDDRSIQQSIETLLDMDFYSYPMQPEKGSQVKRMLFEPMGVDIVIELRDSIIEVLNIYEPRIEIEEIKVTPDYENNSYGIRLVFRILNSIDLTVLSFILRRLS